MNDYGFIHKYPYTNFHELNLDYLLELYNKFNGQIDSFYQKLEELELKLDQIYDFYNDLINGTFPEDFKNVMIKFISDHAYNIIGEMIKNVFFGLDQNGYFVAYVPESWQDIIFGTSGLDDFPEGITYGHLTLTY